MWELVTLRVGSVWEHQDIWCVGDSEFRHPEFRQNQSFEVDNTDIQGHRVSAYVKPMYWTTRYSPHSCSVWINWGFYLSDLLLFHFVNVSSRSVSSSQLQSSGPAALQKLGAAQRETPVRHRGDGGIRAGVTRENRREAAKGEQLIQWNSFCY